VERYERACDRGDANACGRLGFLYSEGKSVESDPARAMELFDRACAGSDATGCYNLAVELLNGPEATRDARRARSVLEGPCQERDVRSCGFLGILERDGVGGPTDLPNAIRNFELACDGGNNIACTNLAAAYWKGAGVDGDPERAAELFRRACAGGYSLSCRNLERLESGELPPGKHTISAHTTIETTTINGLVFEGIRSSCDLPQTMMVLAILKEAAGQCAKPQLSPQMFVAVENGRAGVGLEEHTAVGSCFVRAATQADFGDTVCSLFLALRQP
jgi:hypothetical protein